jgi:hypothetical protein
MGASKRKTSQARRSMMGGKTSRSTYVRSKPLRTPMENWGGSLPTMWPKCRQHGMYLRPSARFSVEDGVVLVCAALPAPARNCPFNLVVALSGLPPELAAAFRLGGPDGFANMLGIEAVE